MINNDRYICEKIVKISEGLEIQIAKAEGVQVIYSPRLTTYFFKRIFELSKEIKSKQLNDRVIVWCCKKICAAPLTMELHSKLLKEAVSQIHKKSTRVEAMQNILNWSKDFYSELERKEGH